MTVVLKQLLLTGAVLLTGVMISPAQLTVLHSFDGSRNDGANPNGSLALAGAVLYGATPYGGITNYGTLFKINTDGTGYTNLYHCRETATGGSEPWGSPLAEGTALYGMTSLGGPPVVIGFTTNATTLTVTTNYSINGTVFKIDAATGAFTSLHNFTGLNFFGGSDDGSQPWGDLVLGGSALYGCTRSGGTGDKGIIFAVNTNGTGYTVLHNFIGGSSDGSTPGSSMKLLGNVLYGLTTFGGSDNYGTVFKINTDGTGYTVLYNFRGAPWDGSHPQGSLLSSGGMLYGLTPFGGTNGFGTLFQISTNGTGYSTLYDFAGTLSDGANPYGSLALYGGMLYGLTAYGGSSNVGTVFGLATTGSSYQVFHNFTGGSGNGSMPFGSPTVSGCTLYGMTSQGGTADEGVVFSLALTGTTAFASFTVSPSSGWAPLPVTFTDISVFNGIYNRYWDFGDGFTTNTASEVVTHTYTSTATSTVTLVMSCADGIYTSIQTAAVSAIIPVAPLAGFTVSPALGVAPLTVTFTDTSSGTVTNRYWDFGDGATSNTSVVSVSHTYTSVGTETVTLIASGPAGTSTNTQAGAVTLTLLPPPTADFTASPTNGLNPLTVTFTDISTGTITNRYWDFGDGFTTNTTAINVTHTYTSEGSETVMLVVCGPAGVATNTQAGLITVTAAVGATVTNIIANTADNYIGLNTNGVSVLGGSVSAVALSIGDDNATYGRSNQCAVVMFALPVLQAGQAITTANLALEISTGYPGGEDPFPKGLDIYGLRYSASSAISTNDYGFKAIVGTNDTLIMDNIAQFAQNLPSYPYTVYETDVAADAVLANWINAQYAAGAVGGNYVFLRIHPDARTANPIYVASANSTTNTKPTLTLEIGSAAPNPDSNGNGILDSWEIQYFGGVTNINPSALAANGINTFMETYIAGLNPTNPASVFLISDFRALTSASTLQWQSASGRVYSVYWTTNLMNSFQPLETNIVWPQNSWTDLVNAVQADGFYKIKVRLGQ